MIKKGLFKKITALTLSLCLAASPAVVYAAEDGEEVVVEVFVDEQSSSVDDDYADDSTEEVFTDDNVQEDVNEEETVFDESEFADVVIEDSKPEFVEDSEFEEQSVTEDVAAAEEAFGVDDTTMEMLVAGGEDDVVDDVVTEDIAAENASLAGVTITFNSNG